MRRAGPRCVNTSPTPRCKYLFGGDWRRLIIEWSAAPVVLAFMQQHSQHPLPADGPPMSPPWVGVGPHHLRRYGESALVGMPGVKLLVTV
jgi:hypothetical protein